MKLSILSANDNSAMIVKALQYAFPKKGNELGAYRLTVEGEPVKVAKTGGGKNPRYVYLMINGTSYYLPKNVEPATDTDIKIMAEEPKAPKVAPKAPEALPTGTPAEVLNAIAPEVATIMAKAAEPEVATKPKRSKK